MVDYKKFLQVKKILEADLRKDITGWSAESDFAEPTVEDRASAICDLFDTQKVSQATSWYLNHRWLDFQNTPTPIPC